MNPWELYKFVLLLQILFPRRNLTFCGSHGHKGYSGAEPGYRPENRSKGGPGHIHRGHTSRGTHYGPRRFHHKLESATRRPDYDTVRPKDTVYHTSLDKQRYHTSQQTSTAHGTLIDIDITSKRSTNKVKYYWDEKSRADVYTSLNPYLIARVLKKDKVIWKAKDGNYPVMVSVGVNERGKPKLTVLYPGQEDHHLKSYRKSTSGPVVTGREHRPAHPMEQRYGPTRRDKHHEPVILDIRTSGDTEEFKYYHDREKNTIVFTAKAPYLFHSIVKGDKVLWTAKDHRYPVKVTVGVNKRGKPSLTVIYPGEQDHLHPPDRDRRHPKGVSPTRRTHRPTKPPMDHEPVILDIDLRHTLEYKYHWDSRNRLDIFTANYPFAFHSIVKGDRVLWRAKAGLYPVKVTVGVNERGKPRLTVFYPEEAVHGPPTPLPRVKRPPTVPTPPVTERVKVPPLDKVRPALRQVELDIEKDKVNTNSYTYFFDNSTNTSSYTCKRGYAISSIRQGPSLIWSADPTTDVTTRSSNVYAHKVLIQGVESKDRTLIIYLMNGKIKRFTRSSKYCGLTTGEWSSTEVLTKGMDPLDPKHHPKEIKITMNDSSLINDTSKYNVTHPDEDVFDYTFNKDVKCAKIAYLDKDVWTHLFFSPHPESFIYNRREKEIILVFSLEVLTYRLNENGNWEQSSSFSPFNQFY